MSEPESSTARCARHPEAAASAACPRCGDYVCALCIVPGAKTCRRCDLTTTENAETKGLFKRTVGRVLLGCGTMIVLVVLAFGVFIWRMNASLNKRKDEITQAIDSFTQCMAKPDDKCLSRTTTWTGDVRNNSLGFREQVRERLGARRGGEPVEKTWSINQQAHVDTGARTTVSVQYLAMYEHDDKATESFVLIDDGKGFRVHGFKLNSPRMFESPTAGAKGTDK